MLYINNILVENKQILRYLYLFYNNIFKINKNKIILNRV